MKFNLDTENINYVKITYKDSDGFSHCVKSAIKQINDKEIRTCVKTEESLPNGRLLDIDITDKRPISRSDLGLPPRRCFICSGVAAECVATQRHSREEIAAFIEGCGL